MKFTATAFITTLALAPSALAYAVDTTPNSSAPTHLFRRGEDYKAECFTAKDYHKADWFNEDVRRRCIAMTGDDCKASADKCKKNGKSILGDCEWKAWNECDVETVSGFLSPI